MELTSGGVRFRIIWTGLWTGLANSEIQREADGGVDALESLGTESADALSEGFDRKRPDLNAFHPPVAIQA